MKTFDKKDVFTLVTAEEAKAYIGKQGYFGDSFSELEEDIKKGCSGRLEDVFPDRYTSIVFRPYACETSYGLFIPTDKVKEVKEPKKWRAFKDIEEFKKETGLGLLSIVQYRYIIEKPRNLTTTGFGVITDFCTCSDKTYYITIGDTSFNLNELFDYEYLDEHGDWKPFGVLDET